MYLWLCSAPNILASSTASLMTTRQGMSGWHTELVHADGEDGTLDRVERRDRAVQDAVQVSFQGRDRDRDLADQQGEICLVDLADVPFVHELAHDLVRLLSRHLPLVEGLDGTTPGPYLSYLFGHLAQRL